MFSDVAVSELFTLFFSGFISSTLLPGGSEVLLIYYIKNNPESGWAYLIVVTIGNSLGALFTYFMGYYFHWGREKAQKKHQKATRFCQKYGVYSLLLSWLPIVGDLLPLVAGWLKLSIIKSVIYITAGKALRYSLILISTLYLL
ncbi:membrane protein [Psychromonas marina]|uniref:Membrane protein n=1 Tax=Psychromonas marina TaxID=88364 RepID=A0ABQ6DXM5_9GAMM|nr:YqaA family protein [Psychromonas marina]GLS89715.1 membrane protein [Psychromonas marina]